MQYAHPSLPASSTGTASLRCACFLLTFGLCMVIFRTRTPSPKRFKKLSHLARTSCCIPTCTASPGTSLCSRSETDFLAGAKNNVCTAFSAIICGLALPEQSAKSPENTKAGDYTYVPVPVRCPFIRPKNGTLSSSMSQRRHCRQLAISTGSRARRCTGVCPGLGDVRRLCHWAYQCLTDCAALSFVVIQEKGDSRLWHCSSTNTAAGRAF